MAKVMAGAFLFVHLLALAACSHAEEAPNAVPYYAKVKSAWGTPYIFRTST